MNTTEAYRASKALLVRKPPAMAAASVPTHGDGQGTSQRAGADVHVDVPAVGGETEQAQPGQGEEDEGQGAALAGSSLRRRMTPH